MKLNDLKPTYDYSKEGVYLVLKLWKKKNNYVEIICGWFDYNRGNKINWLLVREHNPGNGKRKYTNYKLKNIQENVKVARKHGKEIPYELQNKGEER